ncbi:MAG: DUF4328 domain-containing protein [Verrucomicrobiae bacterium]|nr:DUF4328 domain-containing protein [Verrucomicrobiae bacterium]
MEWYYAKDGGQVGPYTDIEFRALLESGEISGDTLVWHEELTDWQLLNSVQPAWFGNAIPVSSSIRPPEVAVDEPVAVCAVSGAVRPQSELLRYGNEWVAPENKDIFLQRLREGVSAKGENPTSGGYTFQDPQGRAKLAKVMMIVFTVTSILTSILDAVSPDSGAEELTAVDWVLAATGLSGFVAFILSVVFFSMWTHRVVSNAYALGGEWMEITPGWAVGWYFVPLANLIRPYQALKQTWQTTFESDEVSPVMPAWWGFWLISNFLSNFSFRLSIRGETEISQVVSLVSSLFELGSLITVIVIVNRLTQEQVSRTKEWE